MVHHLAVSDVDKSEINQVGTMSDFQHVRTVCQRHMKAGHVTLKNHLDLTTSGGDMSDLIL